MRIVCHKKKAGVIQEFVSLRTVRFFSGEDRHVFGGTQKIDGFRASIPIFDLQSRRSKNPPSSIFGPEDRITPHLQSSIFGPEDRRTPHLRSSAPNSGPKIGRKTGVGCDFFEDGGSFEDGGVLRYSGSETRKPLFSIFGAGRTKTPHLPPSRPEERRTPFSFFFRPPPQPTLAGSPEGRSSDRSSSSKIGPKIEIGPLLK